MFQGAFWGLIIGLIIGLIRMGLDFGYGSPNCGEVDHRPAVISKVHFLHFTIILFFVSIIATMFISYFTEPIDEKHVRFLLPIVYEMKKYIQVKFLSVRLQCN